MATGKYSEWIKAEGLVLIEGWAREGLTDEQIAENIGISRTTLYEWKKLYPDIADALKRGKAPVNMQVENALLKRALGYEYEETVTEIYTDVDGEQKKHIKKVIKHIAPDPTSMIFWLKNRRPDRWRDRPALDDMGDDRLQAYLDKLENEIHVEQ